MGDHKKTKNKLIMKDQKFKKELENFLKKSFKDSLKKDPKTISVSCLQFGDTGKGKFVDLFANWAEIIARGTGGDNAGHTVICNGESKVFHLIPSGITHDCSGKINVIGSGTAVYPKTLVEEIKLLFSQGMSVNNLMIALNAKLIMPYHIVMDRISESNAGKAKIVTTGKGIGPAYSDFIARRGLIINDLFNPSVFREKLVKNLAHVSRILSTIDRDEIKKIMNHEHLESGFYYHEQKFGNDSHFFEAGAIISKYLEYAKFLLPYIADTDSFMKNNLGKKNILLEGAQGALLDVDYGTYPYVTSSNCTAAGLAKGVGLKQSDIDVSFGIIKGFYMTRVGKGPFPTEIGGSKSEKWCNGTGTREQEELSSLINLNIEDEFLQGVAIRRVGAEFGATTGRLRRVGWIDLPLLRHALESGSSNIILTKLDILTGVDVIKVCHSYRYDGPGYQYGKIKLEKGNILQKAIVIPEVLEHCSQIYESFSGWKDDISKVKDASNLPAQFNVILDYIFSNIDAKARIISVGPSPEETILLGE